MEVLFIFFFPPNPSLLPNLLKYELCLVKLILRFYLFIFVVTVLQTSFSTRMCIYLFNVKPRFLGIAWHKAVHSY